MLDPKYEQDMAELARILQQKPEITPTLLAVAKALVAVEYGEINIKMQGGKPVWVDSVKRVRVG